MKDSPIKTAPSGSPMRRDELKSLRDENLALRTDIERLRQGYANLRMEFKYDMRRYALPEQRPQMLKDWYMERMGGRRLDLEDPKTFSEKLQWIKLYDLDDLKSRLSDKYAVREWIKETIGEQYLIPLLAVYDSPEQIDYDSLPDKFVIKCNHGCEMNIIVDDKNKLDRNAVARQLLIWLNTTYGVFGFELQYARIKPKIIIEKKMENEGLADLIDYKIYCFNGHARYIHINTDRGTQNKIVFFDTNWVKQSFRYNYPPVDREIEKPDNLDEMIATAERLAKDFKFVRVDLYRMNDGTIYFGEMTFTPMSGFYNWNEPDTDRKLGELLQLK